MDHIHSMVLFAVLALAASVLVFRRGMLDALLEAIDRFRGGPRTPMHPSPAGDTALLRKPAKKTETYHC